MKGRVDDDLRQCLTELQVMFTHESDVVYHSADRLTDALIKLQNITPNGRSAPRCVVDAVENVSQQYARLLDRFHTTSRHLDELAELVGSLTKHIREDHT